MSLGHPGTITTVRTTREHLPAGAGELSYLRGGEGPPLLLLHSLALAGEMWAGVLDDFAAGHEVIAPDFRGHGASTDDGRPFSVEDMAEDLVALLDGLGLEAVDVLGLSMGGSVAFTLAGRHPGRVRRLVACDTTACYGDDAAKPWAERARQARKRPRVAQLGFQVERWFSGAFRRYHPDVVAEIGGIFQRTRPRVHAEACVALGNLDARPLLSEITAPTLCITGEDDFATPPEMGRYAAEHVAHGSFLPAPGLKHFAILESPELRATAVAFLRGSEPGNGPGASACCAGRGPLEGVQGR